MNKPHFIKVFGYMYELHKRNFISYFKPIKDSKYQEIEHNSVHWVGHATTVINLEGKLIVTDPVTSISLGHLKRQVRPSLRISDFHMDYILLSHGHMDHLDYNTLRKINRDAKVLCPKNYGASLRLFGYKNIFELEPGEKYKDEYVVIEAIEANHDGRRYYLGNKSKSNAYAIRGKEKSVFFAGDTAYTEEFNGINADIAIMPVGCYTPDEFREMHCSPEESYSMFKAMDIPLMIPIHYKTYILSQDDEEVTYNTLLKLSSKDPAVKIIDVGETVEF